MSLSEDEFRRPGIPDSAQVGVVPSVQTLLRVRGAQSLLKDLSKPVGLTCKPYCSSLSRFFRSHNTENDSTRQMCRSSESARQHASRDGGADVLWPVHAPALRACIGKERNRVTSGRFQSLSQRVEVSHEMVGEHLFVGLGM